MGSGCVATRRQSVSFECGQIKNFSQTPEGRLKSVSTVCSSLGNLRLCTNDGEGLNPTGSPGGPKGRPFRPIVVSGDRAVLLRAWCVRVLALHRWTFGLSFFGPRPCCCNGRLDAAFSWSSFLCVARSDRNAYHVRQGCTVVHYTCLHHGPCDGLSQACTRR